MNRRIPYTVAVAAAIALGAAACSSSSSNSTGAGSAPSSGSASGAAHGKPLTIVTTQLSPLTDNFNPFMATGTAYTMHVQDLLYLPLGVYNTQNPTQAVTPELMAPNNGYRWSGDGKTLTVTVRSGMKWSDGTPVTGADVAYTFNTISAKSNASMDQYQEPSVASATSSGQTATLTFATPQVTNMFSIFQVPIVPQHIWSKQANPASWTDPTPVSDGPFELGQFSAQAFTLKANPGYYAASSIKVPEIDVPAYTSNATLLTPTADGTIDWSGTSITGVQSNYLAKSTSNTTWTTSAPYFADNNVVGLYFNTTKPGLNNADVRKAISDSINRQALSTTGESGNEPSATSASGMLLPAQQAFLPSSMANDLSATGNATEAGSLMKKAGYAKVGGFWEKGGQKVHLAIQDPASYTDYNTDATLIAAQLKAAGFDASADLDGGTNGPTEWTTNLNNGNFDAAIHWGQQGLTPYNTYDDWMDYTKSAPIGQAAGADISRFNDPAAQAALAAYSGATSSAAETTALQTLAGIEESQVPVAPLLYGASWAEFSTRNYTGWPSSSNAYSDPGPNPTEVLAVLSHLTPVS